MVIPKGKPGRKKRKAQTTALPSIPEGETEETLEAQQKVLVGMWRDGKHDLPRVKALMDNTFAKRRREVLINNLRVWQLLNKYPFLKDCKGVEVSCLLMYFN